jgi:hypothetical protein
MNSSQTELSYVAEDTWGVTPTSPAPVFQAIRMTGESLKITNESVVSDEIRPDRNVPDTILVGGDASGGIDGELSYGTFDDFIESVLFSTWSGSPANSIVNGTTQKSFTLQKKQEGNGLAAVYELYKGMVVDTMTINIAAKEKTTVGFTFVGKGGSISAAKTGTVTDAGTTEILDGANAFTLSKAWTTPLPKLMNMTINISNGLSGRSVAGSRDLVRVSASRCTITGSASFYFETKAMMDLFLAGTAGEIAVTLGKVTGEKYTITLPNVKITDADHFSPNNDDDVMLNVTWSAHYHDSIDGTIKIDRAVA